MSRRGCQHGPGGREGIALPVGAPVREQEACGEHEHDHGGADSGSERDRVRPFPRPRDLLAGE
jgi:hypothetical protein